jgi:hypothetical protein
LFAGGQGKFSWRAPSHHLSSTTVPALYNLRPPRILREPPVSETDAFAVMVRTRLQYLEQQLVESKTVWDEEKSAHARMKRANVCTIERLADSERKLRELERKLSESERDRRLAKEHAQDMALVCKVRGGFDTSDTTGMGHVAQYTDDVSLSKRLPSIPSHLWHTPDATSPTLHPTCPTSTTRDGDKASRDVEHEPAVKAEFKTSKQLRHSHEEIEYVETYPGKPFVPLTHEQRWVWRRPFTQSPRFAR